MEAESKYTQWSVFNSDFSSRSKLVCSHILTYIVMGIDEDVHVYYVRSLVGKATQEMYVFFVWDIQGEVQRDKSK